MINTKFQQTAFLSSNFNDYRNKTNPSNAENNTIRTQTTNNTPVQTQPHLSSEPQISTHNKKKNIIKWLFEPLPTKQTLQQTQTPTTNRLQKIISGVVAVLVYAYLFFAVKSMVKGTNGPQSALFDKNKDIWHDLSEAMPLNKLALPKVLVETVENLKNKISNPTEFLNKGGFKKNSSVLLYGPPGTGKTTFAKAIAKEFPDSRFASLDLTSIEGSYMGETERNLNSFANTVCDFADKNKDKKVFVFIDEIDTFAVEDNGSHNQQYTAGILNALKTCLSEKLGKRDNIFTFAATNIDIDPDKEIVNSGKKLSKPILDRFTNRIKVNDPTKEQFEVAISNHYSKCPQVAPCLKNPKSPEVQELAQKLADDKSSFRTLETLFDNAAATACAEDNILDFNHILNALKSIKTAEDKLTGSKTRPMGFQYQA